MVDQVVGLEDETDVIATETGQGVRRQGADVVTADDDLAAGGDIESGRAAEKGRLAGAGRPHHGRERTVGQCEGDPTHRKYRRWSVRIGLVQIDQADRGVGVRRGGHLRELNCHVSHARRVNRGESSLERRRFALASFDASTPLDVLRSSQSGIATMWFW